MSETYHLRQKWIEIARRDKGKVETTKNHGQWIEKLWPLTNYPDGYKNREPYCAAGMAYCLHHWLLHEDVRKALGLADFKAADKWRCQSAVAFEWLNWAKKRNLIILPAYIILHAADIAVYSHSHIELVTDDDDTPTGPFVAIGYNTNASGSRDGEGCHEKPRFRNNVKNFIRILP